MPTPRLVGAVYSTRGELGLANDPCSIDVTRASTEPESLDCEGADCINDHDGSEDRLCVSCREDVATLDGQCACCQRPSRLEYFSPTGPGYCVRCLDAIVMTWTVLRAAEGFRPRKCIDVQGVTVSEVA